MRIREIVIYLYLIVFFLGLASMTPTMQGVQGALIFGFYALVGICGIILANWVHADGTQIEELSAKVDYVNQRLSELEKSQKT